MLSYFWLKGRGGRGGGLLPRRSVADMQEANSVPTEETEEQYHDRYSEGLDGARISKMVMDTKRGSVLGVMAIVTCTIQ
jgi:hypothetical protein